MTYNRTLKMDRSLSARWYNLQLQNPDKTNHDISTQLEVTEEQLVSSRCGRTEESNTRLIPKPIKILSELASLGEMKFVTDNAAVRHEVIAVLTNIYSSKDTDANNTPLFSPKNVNAQFNFNLWHSVYAVNEKGQLSLQFFDQQGHSVYRAYVLKQTSLEDYKALINQYKSDDQSSYDNSSIKYHSGHTQEQAHKSQDINTWRASRSAQDCEDVIDYYDEDPLAMYLSLGALFSTHIGAHAVKSLLQHLLKYDFNIKITTKNRGTEQVWTGILDSKSIQGSYLKLSEKEFSLTVNIADIGDIWLVKIPSFSGHMTALEIYDKQNNHIMSLEEKCEMNHFRESKKWEKLMSMLINIEQESQRA